MFYLRLTVVENKNSIKTAPQRLDNLVCKINITPADVLEVNATRASAPCKHAITCWYGPVLARCCWHRTSTGPVLAPTGMFTTKMQHLAQMGGITHQLRLNGGIYDIISSTQVL